MNKLPSDRVENANTRTVHKLLKHFSNDTDMIQQKFISQLVILGPNLQRILCETYDSAALMPDLRQACELRVINKKS